MRHELPGKTMRTRGAEPELSITAVPEGVLAGRSRQATGEPGGPPRVGPFLGGRRKGAQPAEPGSQARAWAVRGREEDSGGPQLPRPEAGRRLLHGHRQGTSPAQGRGHRTAVRTTSPTTALSLSELVWVAPVFKNPPCPRAADTRPSRFHQEPDSAPRSPLTAAPASAPTARPLPPHRGSGCGFPQLAVTFRLSAVKGTFPSDLAAFLRCFPLGAAAPLPHFSCSNF